jgi:hypothetical protein
VAGRRRRGRAGTAVPLLNGKVVNLTGPRRTARWGVTGTDLGASVVAPNGKLVSVFGDTFSGRKVGQGDWRSPVVLIGTGDADHEIVYERAGGDDPNYAHQLWHYIHDDAATGWTQGGISTVIPSDLLRVDDSIYLHAIVNRGFGNVIWTEIWRSDDSGITWSHMGEDAKFPADLYNGYAQCWSWDYDPDDGWVYVAATGFQRDKGIILMRVRPEHIGQRSRYVSWGYAAGRWDWGQPATPITPEGERWGELTFRRVVQGKWVLGGFLASKYALGYRVVDSPRGEHAHHRTPAPRAGFVMERPEPFQEQDRAALRRLSAARLTVRRRGRCRPGGVPVAHRHRMALSRNAIQGRAQRQHDDRAATGSDQPVN